MDCGEIMFIEVNQVSFAYPSQFRHRAGARLGRDEHAFSLAALSAGIEHGTLTGLLGPNGCGKTTLLRLMAGVLRPQHGSIMIDGEAVDRMPRRKLGRRIAIVPQETHPAFDYTAMEMVLMGRHPHLDTFQLEGPNDYAIAAEALTATGTGHLAARAYATLSGGEKQRVVIAGALAQQPEVLLLDEPTASLDLAYQLEVSSLLTRLNRDRAVTMVLATHDLNLAASVCDRLVLMRAGEILAHGATADVLTQASINQLYNVEADVQFHEMAGHLTVVPIRRIL